MINPDARTAAAQASVTSQGLLKQAGDCAVHGVHTEALGLPAELQVDRVREAREQTERAEAAAVELDGDVDLSDLTTLLAVYGTICE